MLVCCCPFLKFWVLSHESKLRWLSVFSIKVIMFSIALHLKFCGIVKLGFVVLTLLILLEKDVEAGPDGLTWAGPDGFFPDPVTQARLYRMAWAGPYGPYDKIKSSLCGMTISSFRHTRNPGISRYLYYKMFFVICNLRSRWDCRFYPECTIRIIRIIHCSRTYRISHWRHNTHWTQQIIKYSAYWTPGRR